MGSNHALRLAGIAWSLVSRTDVVVTGRRWILDIVKLGFGFQFPLAVVIGGDFSSGRVAGNRPDLVRVGLGRIPPTD